MHTSIPLPEDEELCRRRTERLVRSPPGRVTAHRQHPVHRSGGHEYVPRMRAGLGYAFVFTVAPRRAERQF